MHSSFALDLKTVRRQSGLAQRDCAHLLGTTKRRVGVLETGKAMPSVPEIVSLSLIFGRSFESLFGAVFDAMRKEVGANLSTLPDTKGDWRSRFNRRNTLSRLAQRLDDSQQRHV